MLSPTPPGKILVSKETRARLFEWGYWARSIKVGGYGKTAMQSAIDVGVMGVCVSSGGFKSAIAFANEETTEEYICELGKINPGYKDCIVRCYSEGRVEREIARKTGLSKTTVNRWLRDAEYWLERKFLEE